MAILIVSLSEGLEFSFSESEIHHGQDRAELRDSDFTLAELVEIAEELLNSHSLHNYLCLETQLYI